MSEGPRRTLKCLACGAVAWTEGLVPKTCPTCATAWSEPGVAILERPSDSYVRPDGASVLKDG